jgi:probable rRNA maturation factor
MVLNHQNRVPVALRPLNEFLRRVGRELRFPSESVTVRLVSDTAMATLNRTFRGKNGATDVLSFPSDDYRAGSHETRTSVHLRDDGFYVGDIAIAPAVARRNAKTYARTLSQEMRLLILHGMIHLAGYDHERDNGRMQRYENRLRRRLNLVRQSQRP